ncbi:MAG TPA: Na+/H+ antiporter NhaC family protein [Acidobacteriota bacterium]|nr:Na+/H+ antiporter NhaC family protein [Acidobacteriota bacterium]
MSKSRFPHPLVLLVAGALLAAALTHLVPAGEYDRREDPATGRNVVVAGTYHPVERNPIGPFGAIVAIPKGMVDAASVIFLVFLVGGAFTVVDQTGALRGGVDWFASKLQHRKNWMIPVVSLAFATGGALENLQEEIIPMVPVLVILTRRFGYDVLVASSISIGAAIVGSAFSPINPFQVQIAQKVAAVPLLSGSLFRMLFLLPAIALWIWGTIRYAKRSPIGNTNEEQALEQTQFPARSAIILFLVAATFGVFVYGVLSLGWDFDQMSALFLIMGVLAGLIGRLGIRGTAEAFVEGFRGMAYAGVLIGFARAIYYIMNEGHIIDSIVNALFIPIAALPVVLSAFGMVVVHNLIHFPVPSVSGQAVLTMPILAPLSDLLGLSRQVTILAYQYGAGLCEMITPTNGALMAILAAAGVSYENWIRFAFPLYLALSALGLIAIGVGIAVGLK